MKENLQKKAKEEADKICDESLNRIIPEKVNNEETWIEISEPTFHLNCYKP